MNVAIFGAGIAGLSVAIALTAAGHRCRVFDKRPACGAVGMGFILLPSGQQSLMGLAKGIGTSWFSDHGVLLSHFVARDGNGNITHTERMPSPSIGLSRAVLIDTLLTSLPGDEAVFNVRLESLILDDNGAVRAARMTGGEMVQADLYVAADGCRSLARRSIFSSSFAEREAQVMEVVGACDCPPVADWAAGNLNKFHRLDLGLAFGILPVSARRIVWYLQFDTARYTPPVGGAMALRQFVHDCVGTWADPIAAAIGATECSAIHLWRPLDTDPPPVLYSRNLVLVGDAAHPLLPFTSQGLSAALADAVYLGQVIDSLAALPAALCAYSTTRRGHCAGFVRSGRELTAAFLGAGAIGAGQTLPLSH